MIQEDINYFVMNALSLSINDLKLSVDKIGLQNIILFCIVFLAF